MSVSGDQSPDPRFDFVHDGGSSLPALPVPLSASSSARSLRLLSHAYARRSLSKAVLLTLNPLLTNRDGFLWDNLPWATWTVDPSRDRLYDAAANPVLSRYHPGKRDAYERMIGKDWKGRSLSGGNLRARLKYWLEGLDDWLGGVGGTGVVTIGAMLTMGAHIEGNHFSSIDQFGMAQKGGAVTSHLRLVAIEPQQEHDPELGVARRDGRRVGRHVVGRSRHMPTQPHAQLLQGMPTGKLPLSGARRPCFSAPGGW